MTHLSIRGSLDAHGGRATLSASRRRVCAHDLWIEASAFRPDPGRVVGLHLLVGQDFLGDPIPRDPALIEQFVAITPDATVPIVGQDGADPAGLLRQTTPALVVIAYRSRSTAITLPPEKFNQYLRDEGLDDVAPRSSARIVRIDAPARELFARCAKALLQAGSHPHRRAITRSG